MCVKVKQYLLVFVYVNRSDDDLHSYTVHTVYLFIEIMWMCTYSLLRRTYCCTSWDTDFLFQRVGAGMTHDLSWTPERLLSDWVLLRPNASIAVPLTAAKISKKIRKLWIALLLCINAYKRFAIESIWLVNAESCDWRSSLSHLEQKRWNP